MGGTMTNPIRGEVEIEISGFSYKLKFGTDAQIAMEVEFGRLYGRPAVPLSQIVAEHLNPPLALSVLGVRTAFWAGLRKYHQDVTIAKAGELIDDAGGSLEVLTKVSEAFRFAFPDAEARDDSTRPPAKASEEASISGTNGIGEPTSSPTLNMDSTPIPSGTSRLAN